MRKRALFLILSSILLTGCFAESMTLVQSGFGASQGRALQSTISPAISFSVKHTTGKFPVEHIIMREKQRIAKKASDFEKAIIQTTKEKAETSKEKFIPIKKNIENQVTRLNDQLIKVKTFTVKNFKHKPRFSYKAR